MTANGVAFCAKIMKGYVVEVTKKDGQVIEGVFGDEGLVGGDMTIHYAWTKREAGSKTRVARMNVDAYADYASAYAVTGFPTLMLFENGRPVGAKTGLVDMTTAMKYAGVRDEGVLAKFAPEKKLDKILSGAQVEYVQGELGEVRKELGGIQDPASRARALEALQQVESIVGVRAL